MKLLPVFCISLMSLLLSQSAQAISYFWDGGGTDDLWTNSANWGGDTVVPSTTNDLRFDGSTRLTPDNDFTAGSDFRHLTFEAGASAFTLDGNAITLNGVITNNSSNLQTIDLDMELAAGSHSVTTAGGGADVTLGGIISGSGSLSKGGSGQLTLSAANTFDGEFSLGGPVAGSSVRLANADALQNSVFNLSSNNAVIFASGIGNFKVAGLSVNNTLTLADEAAAAVTLTIQGTGNQAATGAKMLDGAGSVVFNLDSDGLQTFTYSNAAANTVSYTINSGTVQMLQQGLAKNTNDLTINGGTLDFNATSAGTRNFTWGSLSGTGGIITTSGSVTTTLLSITQATDGNFAGSIEQGVATTFSITKLGSATLTLSGSNNYNGTTLINPGGALKIQNDHALGTLDEGTTIFSGAALQIEGGISTAEAIVDVRGTGISNTGAVRNISGDNTFSGLVTLVLASRINSDAGTLTFSGGITAAGNVGLDVGGAGNTSITSAVTTGVGGGAYLRKDGSGTLTLSGTNTYGGGTTISEGTVIAGTDSLAGTDGAFGNSAAAINLGSASLTGAASILTNGAFTIGRNITEVASPTNSSFSIGGIQTSGTSTYTGNIILTKATTLTSATGGQVDFTGIISGVGINTTIAGGGTVSLGGVNTYSGLTTISAGTLVLAGGGTINNSSGVNLGTSGSQGTLDLTSKASYSFGAGQTVSGYGTINIGAGKVVTIANLAPGNSPGQINVTGGLVLTTTTVMELAGTGGVKGGDFDNTTVTEALTYGGDLSIVSFGGFNINQPGTYSLFDFASQSGNFANVSVGATALSFGAGKWTGTDSGFDYSFDLASGDFTVVPEPSTALLLVGALSVLALRRRRKV